MSGDAGFNIADEKSQQVSDCLKVIEEHAQSSGYIIFIQAKDDLSKQTFNAIEPLSGRVAHDVCTQPAEYLMEQKHYEKYLEPNRKSVSDYLLERLPGWRIYGVMI